MSADGMQRTISKYAGLVTVAVCCWVLAAGPLAMEGRPWPAIVWSGLIAAAAYVKGKLEKEP